jgi:mono/diheme cytochrome c family protein
MTGALAFSGKSLAAFGAVLVVLLVVAVLTARRMRTREHGPDIPDAMAPGPSDADLEKPLLEKLQAWMLVLIVFFAIWIPLYWLAEPGQNVNDEILSTKEGIERGRQTTEQFEEGVNELGFGCVRCHGAELKGGLNYFEGQFVNPPSLVDVCGRLTLDQIYETIREGRPPTDMPSWSIRFAGPLDDQQINDIVQYLMSIQTMPKEQNKCINPPKAAT